MENKKITYLGVGLVSVSAFVILLLVVFSSAPEVQTLKVESVADAVVTEQAEVVQADEYVVDESDYLEIAEYTEISNLTTDLSQVEIDGLMLMREEEKLARDVYTALAERWGVPIFSNIAASEETHMAVMGDLLSKYSLTDPVVVDVYGQFVNPELQELYNGLVERGSVSRTEAFQVGALIEDLDIYDLKTLLNQTTKEDIITVYKNLQKGSRNHLRAFVKQIEKNGETYTPTYISTSEYQSIISSGQERGQV